MHTRFGAGLFGGLIAGIVYGMFLQLVTVPGPQGGVIPMMELIGAFAGSPTVTASSATSWPFHLLISGFFGIIFGLLMRREIRLLPGAVWGMLYGTTICLAFAYVFYPIVYGVGPYGFFGSPRLIPMALGLLGGHLLYGLVLGVLYSRARSVRAAAAKSYPEDRGPIDRRAA